jgi:hypothetical protein
MSSRADMYRQKAAEAKNRAAQASNPHVKSAFHEVARAWLALAEQIEWMDGQAKVPSTTSNALPRGTSGAPLCFLKWSPHNNKK